MSVVTDDEHQIELHELYQRTASSPLGLSSFEAVKRKKEYGPNLFEAKKSKPLFLRFAKHLFNLFAILLWMGALLAFVADYLDHGDENLYIGIALCTVIFFNAAFSFYQEFQAEKIIDSFHRMMPSATEVLRDGLRQEIPSKELVPGDIIYLEEGKKIPADGRLISQEDLKVDNSSLTGESEPQLRSLKSTHPRILESRNMVFSGTLVQTGHGVALVYKTANATQIGRIAALTKETEGVSSPLREEINYFIKVISLISLSISSLFFALNLLSGNGWIASVIFSIGVLVANVPEGLLPTVTLCLRLAARKMARRRALIKKLEAVETLGSTTVICTDKTGTITENKATVNTLFLNLEEFHTAENGIDQLMGIKELLMTATLCNNAHLNHQGHHHAGSPFVGDPTEVALLSFAHKYLSIQEVLRENPRVRESPFDSVKRRMLTIHQSDSQEITYLKGAPEAVLTRCNRLLYQNSLIELTEEHKEKIQTAYKRFASRGERVIACGYRDSVLPVEENFIFVALVGMIDPPRKDVHLAISKCQRAGIKVIMITGDSSITAEAIASMVGLGQRHQIAIMTGDQLEASSEEELRAFLRKEQILFARTTPNHKLRIVKALQAMKETVTVTGDGVNDAPALKQADMGVAMGRGGTDVAKEAADMVLMDDHFATIVSAVEEGRAVFGNIKKFIRYILAHLVPEIIPFIGLALLSLPLAITVILILSIDLGTEILPALGLGVETPEDDLMKRPPRKRSERLLTPALLFHAYCFLGIIETLACFSAFFAVLYAGGWSYGSPLLSSDLLYQRATTAYFVGIVFCQVATVFACRTERESIFKKGFFSNRFILFGIFIELLFVWLLLTNEAFQKIFGTQSLQWHEILLPLPFALLILVIEELRKKIGRGKERAQRKSGRMNRIGRGNEGENSG